MDTALHPENIVVGVVGLGLMGSSIVVSLLVAGHPVRAVAPMPGDLQAGPGRIKSHLQHCEKSGLLHRPVHEYLQQVIVTDKYEELADCNVVMECVIELMDIKESVYHKIEEVVSDETIIASNTSAIPISKLQELVAHPHRFLGIHWAEPSYLTRFLEITCGAKTATHCADWIFRLAHYWGKEPTLLRKDIRGFVTNRLMYAVYREGFSLVEKGIATMEDVDKAFKYDAGSWITLMGIFRRMDFLGFSDYAEIFKNIFPQLSNTEQVPAIMEEMIRVRARGTQTEQGLYNYTDETARALEEAYASFNEEIYQLAASYPAGIEQVGAPPLVEASTIDEA